MNKKVFLFGFALILLLVTSGFASARISYVRYDTKDDVRIYVYGERAEAVDITYKKPAERVYFYQVGTYAEMYSKFDMPLMKKTSENFLSYPNQIAFQRSADDRDRALVKTYLLNW